MNAKLTIAALSLSCLALGCGGGERERLHRQTLELHLLRAQLELAKNDKPYLVIDPLKGEISVQLKGARVWEVRWDMDEGGKKAANAFIAAFRGKEEAVRRPLGEKQLFGAEGQLPDSLLQIVSRAMEINPALLQRELPARFQFIWEGTVLDVQTDLKGRPATLIKNLKAEARGALHALRGRPRLSVSMPAESALTLWAASFVGMQTLVLEPVK